jgi:hypothetical protein
MNKDSEKELHILAKMQKIFLFTLIVIAAVLLTLNIVPELGRETDDKNVSVLDPTAAVRQESGTLFGNVRIITDDNLSLSYAQVLINGVSSGDLAQGELLLRVYPGDILSIDGTAYKRELFFYLTAVSSNIDQNYLKVVVSTNGTVAEAGIVVFK